MLAAIRWCWRWLAPACGSPASCRTCSAWISRRACRGRGERPPTYVDLPEMVANLNGNRTSPPTSSSTARLEVPKPEDAEKVKAAMPRLQDMMQTYLREMRPEELRGSAGTYRLREELLARANVAVAPAKISDVLFTQMLSNERTDARRTIRRRTRRRLGRGDRRRKPTECDAAAADGAQPAACSTRPKSTACWVSTTARRPAKPAPACRRSSAPASCPTSACRCWRSSSTGWCASCRPVCATSPPTTSKSASTISSRLRFGDYLNSIPLPAMLAVFKAEEWDNQGLMVIDSAMIYSIVDVLLGGRRGTAAMRIEGRPYTTIERTLVERLIQVVLADLSTSFDPLCPVTFRFERLEVNPRFATISRLSNAAILARLRIDMEDRGGRRGTAAALRHAGAGARTAAATVHGREVRPRFDLGNPSGRTALEHRRRTVGRARRADHAAVRRHRAEAGQPPPAERRPGRPGPVRCGTVALFEGKVGRRKNRVAVRIDQELSRTAASDR